MFNLLCYHFSNDLCVLFLCNSHLLLDSKTVLLLPYTDSSVKVSYVCALSLHALVRIFDMYQVCFHVNTVGGSRPESCPVRAFTRTFVLKAVGSG